MIILKNNKIIGIDRKLLTDLTIELNELSHLSNIINILNLKINELKKEPILINGKYYNIIKKDIISIENIEIYELEETSKPDNIDISLTQQPQLSQQPEEIKLETPSIQLEETSKPDNIDISLTQQPQLSQQPEEIKLETPSIQLEETSKPDNIDISLTQQLQLSEEPKEIEISFDNELEEIKELLSNKKEFDNLVHKELQKASEELEIEYEQLIELYNQLIEQIKEEKKHIYKYISKKDYENLHKSYHKLKGAALNLRLSHFALILKKLDELSKAKENIEIITNITNDFYKIIEKNQSQEENNKKVQINDIILKVIQNYLSTQDEKSFQRDKKYIEKLLNIKLNSLEDLKKLIKE